MEVTKSSFFFFVRNKLITSNESLCKKDLVLFNRMRKKIRLKAKNFSWIKNWIGNKTKKKILPKSVITVY